MIDDLGGGDACISAATAVKVNADRASLSLLKEELRGAHAGGD